MAGVLLLAGCGGKSGSTTSASPSSSTNTLKRLEVKVRRTSAEAPPASMLARVADLLGWPQVAEASHCTVTGTGGGPPVVVTPGVNVGGEQYVITAPTLNSDNSLDVAVSCGGPVGTLHVTGLTPGTAVQVEVTVGAGQVKIEAQGQDVSDVSEASISESGAESESESES